MNRWSYRIAAGSAVIGLLGAAAPAHGAPGVPAGCARAVAISSVTQYEGTGLWSAAPMVFTVTTDGCALLGARIEYTVDHVTTNENDLWSVTGTLTWAPGDFSPRTVTVPIVPDNIPEPNERFVFKGCPTTSTVSVTEPLYGNGWILDDDSSPYGALPPSYSWHCRQ